MYLLEELKVLSNFVLKVSVDFLYQKQYCLSKNIYLM